MEAIIDVVGILKKNGISLETPDEGLRAPNEALYDFGSSLKLIEAHWRINVVLIPSYWTKTGVKIAKKTIGRGIMKM